MSSKKVLPMYLQKSVTYVPGDYLVLGVVL